MLSYFFVGFSDLNWIKDVERNKKMLYRILVLISDISCLLPSGITRFIGKILGELTWLIVPKKRKAMAVRNIKRCLNYSQDEAYTVAKKSWTRFGTMIMEVLRFKIICPNIEKYVTIIGEENIQKAIACGKGGVIATAHSGNWEIIGAALTNKGMKIAGVAQHQRNEDVNKFINYCRSFTNMHITDKLDIKEMMKMLSQKYFIGLIMDQDGGSTGILMPFFGHEASCVQGPAVMSRFKSAPILPVFITEDRPGHHILVVEEPVFTEHTKDKPADIYDMMYSLSQRLEKHIRQYPSEWFWLHDRWKYVEKKKKEANNLQ